MDNIWKIEGYKSLQKSLDGLGKLPTKCVTKAVRKGGNAVMRAVKANAPVDSGTLKRAIKLKLEKSRKKGKRVVEVTYNPADTDLLAGVSPGTGKRYYYPASQEYGYFTRDGGYVPGYHFMRNAAAEENGTFNGLVIETLTSEVDKEWAKKYGDS